MCSRLGAGRGRAETPLRHYRVLWPLLPGLRRRVAAVMHCARSRRRRPRFSRIQVRLLPRHSSLARASRKALSAYVLQEQTIEAMVGFGLLTDALTAARAIEREEPQLLRGDCRGAWKSGEHRSGAGHRRRHRGCEVPRSGFECSRCGPCRGGARSQGNLRSGPDGNRTHWSTSAIEAERLWPLRWPKQA